MVAATSGTTSSTAFDPLRPVADICRRHGVWLHVDAAMAGSAAICAEHRGFLDGLELADSYCFNPHKWLLTNFDCDCFYVKDRAALIEALSVLPEYLRNQASDSKEVIDYRDWQVPLGRRFRALKLWFVLRFYGAEELRAMIRRHIELASSFASWVEGSDDFELAAPVHLNLVCFRHLRGDEVNHELLERLNSSGKLFLTHTKLNGRHHSGHERRRQHHGNQRARRHREPRGRRQGAGQGWVRPNLRRTRPRQPPRWPWRGVHLRR